MANNIRIDFQMPDFYWVPVGTFDSVNLMALFIREMKNSVPANLRVVDTRLNRFHYVTVPAYVAPNAANSEELVNA